MRMARLVWLVLPAAAAAATVLTIGPHPFGPQAFAAGDPAAKAEVIAAFQKLNAMPSFKIKWTSADGSGVAEFIQPDKRHFTGKAVQKSMEMSMEIYQIGTENRTHMEFPGAPAGWRCSSSTTPPAWFDTDKMRKNWDVEVGRLPDTVIDGMPVHGYTDVKKGGEFYVGAQNGLPRRAVEPNKQFTADFYDYGVPISFNPPPCG